MELLKLQRDFESKYGEQTFVDTSVSDTIKNLVMLAGARQDDGDVVRLVRVSKPSVYFRFLKYNFDDTAEILEFSSPRLSPAP